MSIISIMQNLKSEYLELVTPTVVIVIMTIILIMPGWFEIVSQWLSSAIENKLYWLGAISTTFFWVLHKFNDIKDGE